MILCVERLHDFSHSLTHSLRLNVFFPGGCVIFLWRCCVNFSVESLPDFLSRGCMTFFWRRVCVILCFWRLHYFFVERLRDFCVQKLHAFLVKRLNDFF